MMKTPSFYSAKGLALSSMLLAGVELVGEMYGVRLAVSEKTIELYGRRLRGLVNGLWNGSINRSTFTDSVGRALRREFNNAWAEGARTQGIEFFELTPEEQAKLDELISEQSGFISSLADFVQAHLKADGFKLGMAQSRVPMWMNRYNDVMNTAKTMAGADKKLKWTLGQTDHCSSCLKLAGKVKRGSFWIASGIQPQSSSLACGGWRCQCTLLPTTDRASPGRLPSIP